METDKPTIELIAKLSGVSRGTVDRVVNNRPNVKPEKAERVRRIIKKLNYRPNLAARALAKKGKRKLGVLFPAWPGFFEKEIRRGIDAAKNELTVSGIEVIVEQCRSKLPDDFIAHIDALVDDGVHGLAVCAINSVSIKEKIRQIQSQGIQVVTFNSDIADCGRACFVGEDIRKTGVIAAGLMEKITAANSVVLVAAGNLEFKAHRDRVDGFMEFWHGLGRSRDQCRIVETYNDYDATFQKITAALSNDPSVGGVYMANDSVPACVEAAGRLALPRRVRIVAHDLSPEHRNLLLYGAIDFVIGQDMFTQGYRPLKILTNLLNNTPPQHNQEKTTTPIITAESVI